MEEMFGIQRASCEEFMKWEAVGGHYGQTVRR